MKQISFRRMSSSPCGICHNAIHKGYLSAAAVKEHSCVEKACPWLQKLEHSYWLQCERKRLEKKARKYLAGRNPAWTKDDCYREIKTMTLDGLRVFVLECRSQTAVPEGITA